MLNTYNFPRDTFLGFDSIFDTLSQLNHSKSEVTYPPYNVVKKDDNHYLIEIAIAGFQKDEIDLTLEKGVLVVDGKKVEYENNRNDEYIHKGISGRTFKRSFTLADTIKVIGADIINGLLVIGLENMVPEEDKPNTINLGEFSKLAKEKLMLA